MTSPPCGPHRMLTTFLTKAAIAAAHKYSGLQKRTAAGFKIDFKVDPSAPEGVRSMPAYELRK